MKYFIHLPMKMEPIVSSETSAIRTQTPWNYPKRNNLHLLSYLLHAAQFFLRSWPFLSQSRNSPHFIESEVSSPHSQMSADCLILSQINSVHAPSHCQKSHLLSYYLRLGLPSGLFPSGFPIKTLYTPLLSHIRATCSAHLILLDLINRKILGEQYRSLSSSLCSCLHSPVTSPHRHTHTHAHTCVRMCIYIHAYIYALMGR